VRRRGRVRLTWESGSLSNQTGPPTAAAVTNRAIFNSMVSRGRGHTPPGYVGSFRDSAKIAGQAGADFVRLAFKS